MTIYQVRIYLGPSYRIAADYLVSKAEAEAIRASIHPALKPEVVAMGIRCEGCGE